MVETKGYFGQFEALVPEPIQTLLDELEVTSLRSIRMIHFLNEYRHYLVIIRASRLRSIFAESLTQHLGGAWHLFKAGRSQSPALTSSTMFWGRFQLLHGQDSSHHEMVSPTWWQTSQAAAAKFGMKCDVYMGAEDVERQRLNVFRMEMMADRSRCGNRHQTPHDAVDAAFGAWMSDLGSLLCFGICCRSTPLSDDCS